MDYPTPSCSPDSQAAQIDHSAKIQELARKAESLGLSMSHNSAIIDEYTAENVRLRTALAAMQEEISALEAQAVSQARIDYEGVFPWDDEMRTKARTIFRIDTFRPGQRS
jgi:predicted RNase H-like nuclease (RuvC/YqgF family)